MAGLYRLKEYTSIRKFRKLLGLSDYVIKKRTCLKCGKKFTSEFDGHRICTKCIPTVTRDGSGIEVHKLVKGVDKLDD